MNAELEKAQQELEQKRQELKQKRAEVTVITSPPPLDQVRRPKWQKGLENTSRPSEPGPWPPPSLAPVQLGGNLERWEVFDWDRHPKLRAAKRVIVDWYNGLPDSGALVLAGDVGCGKTHLANAIADLYGRWRISYFEEIQLVKKIQDTYGQKGQSEESVISSVFRPDLLILDDLGTYETVNTNWLSNLYNRIFNDYLTVRAKPLLITTNLPMLDDGGMSERIGARSFSRLCDALGDLKRGRYIDLFGITDFRVEKFLGK